MLAFEVTTLAHSALALVACVVLLPFAYSLLDSWSRERALQMLLRGEVKSARLLVEPATEGTARRLVAQVGSRFFVLAVGQDVPATVRACSNAGLSVTADR